MKRIKFTLLGLVFFLFASMKSVAFAQAPTNCKVDEVASDLGCIPQDPIGFVQKFYGRGLGILVFVAVIFMIIGGYNIMMSRGSIEGLERGKSYIFYSIAGLLLAVFGFVFIGIITGQILKIPGFSQ